MATPPAHEFAIPVSDLDAGGRPFAAPVRQEWIRSVLEGTHVSPAASTPDGALDLRVSKSGTDVVVRGSLRAELTVPCARCLEPARVPVSVDLSALAVPASSMKEAHGAAPSKGAKDDDDTDRDLPPDQDEVIPYDGDTVVLDDLVRDELLLGIPMIPLCSDDCPGMSPVPGVQPEAAEEAIDPRLRPLLRLKKMTQ